MARGVVVDDRDGEIDGVVEVGGPHLLRPAEDLRGIERRLGGRAVRRGERQAEQETGDETSSLPLRRGRLERSETDRLWGNLEIPIADLVGRGQLFHVPFVWPNAPSLDRNQWSVLGAGIGG